VTGTQRHILCLNSGSSSLKFAVYRLGEGRETRCAEGAVEQIGLEDARLWLHGERGEVLSDTPGEFPQHGSALRALFGVLEAHRLSMLDAVGHRVVHGGPDHTAHAPVDAPLLARLRELIPLAPLHLPSAVLAIEAVTSEYPQLPQVACFDTAFYRRMPEVAQRLPLPRSLWDEGVRRYGFHGLSYEYVVRELAPEPRQRSIIAHLGNGASLAAVRGKDPIETTMGMTPTGGLMMGTRSGDLDPGVLLYLMAEKGFDAERLGHLVDRESGLLGVSDASSDMKTLLETRGEDPRAAQAVELFCYRVRQHVGALAAVLGGLDTLVFTGGIGERAVPVREEICRDLAHLGVRLDRSGNESHAESISKAGAPCTVRVIPTQEDLMIARHTRALIFG
jgi:acetate kinase